MFRLLHRASCFAPIAAFAIIVSACTEQTTAPVSRDLETHSNVVLPPGYIIDTGPGGTGFVGTTALFSAGNTTCSPQPACSGHFQFLAGKFTIAHSANVTSVEGWMSVGIAGSLDVNIRSDSAPPTGAHIPGHSLASATYAVGTQFLGWRAFDLVVSLSPGTYWVTFEPVANTSFNGGMLGTAASPLADYAFFADGNNRWVTFSAFSQNPAFGFRVYGESFLTAQDLIADLRAYVAGTGISAPVAKKIDGSLQKASTAIGASQTSTACVDLQDVKDYVAKQSVRKIPTSVATEINSRTDVIRNDIGC